MALNIFIRPEALEDIDQAVDWYNERSIKRGSEFLLVMYAELDLLALRPRLSPLSFAIFRKWLMRKFPFNIIYSIDEDRQRINVARIWHQKRNSKELRKSLKT